MNKKAIRNLKKAEAFVKAQEGKFLFSELKALLNLKPRAAFSVISRLSIINDTVYSSVRVFEGGDLSGAQVDLFFFDTKVYEHQMKLWNPETHGIVVKGSVQLAKAYQEMEDAEVDYIRTTIYDGEMDAIRFNRGDSEYFSHGYDMVEGWAEAKEYWGIK